MIRSLQIFTDLVESQSFTETGRRNYLTQSAVSQHLKALEANKDVTPEFLVRLEEWERLHRENE